MSDEHLTMRETAIALHELFSNLVEAGFTKKEALQLVAELTKGKA